MKWEGNPLARRSFDKRRPILALLFLYGIMIRNLTRTTMAKSS